MTQGNTGYCVMSLYVRPAMEFNANRYWKLLISRLRHFSVSPLDLMRRRGFISDLPSKLGVRCFNIWRFPRARSEGMHTPHTQRGRVMLARGPYLLHSTPSHALGGKGEEHRVARGEEQLHSVVAKDVSAWLGHALSSTVAVTYAAQATTSRRTTHQYRPQRRQWPPTWNTALSLHRHGSVAAAAAAAVMRCHAARTPAVGVRG